MGQMKTFICWGVAFGLLMGFSLSGLGDARAIKSEILVELQRTISDGELSAVCKESLVCDGALVMLKDRKVQFEAGEFDEGSVEFMMLVLDWIRLQRQLGQKDVLSPVSRMAPEMVTTSSSSCEYYCTRNYRNCMDDAQTADDKNQCFQNCKSTAAWAGCDYEDYCR